MQSLSCGFVTDVLTVAVSHSWRGKQRTFKDYCIIHKMINVAASPMESFLQMVALNRYFSGNMTRISS